VSYVYDANFFAWNNHGVRQSAREIVAILMASLRAGSVLDVGCGQGVWLHAWQEAGATRVVGLDGAYVDQERLLVPRSSFVVADLSQPFDLGERFDLVQSLEVAEHLRPSVSTSFIDSLTRHGDVVLFSAAVPGQGGEYHVNERPLEFWRDLFRQRGYACFDPIRPAVQGKATVQSWYQYNTLLYANAAGAARLPPALARTRVADGEPLREGGDLLWRARRAIVRRLPTRAVNYLARRRAAWNARKAPAE
jgi:SAM-dependent methyltransferase